MVNTAFYPNSDVELALCLAFERSFDNSGGFLFPVPEGLTLSYLPHLLVAQAFIPPTERVEVAGFSFPGDNDAIRTEVLLRINNLPDYRTLFGQAFPAEERARRSPLTWSAQAIAEFEFSLFLPTRR